MTESYLLDRAGPSLKNVAAGLASLLLLLTLASFLLRNRALVAAGGSDWVHGEWLISFAAGPLRRGLSGTVILTLSDWTGLSPLVFVEVAQGLAIAALVLVLIWTLWRIGFSERIILCLVSPAFVLMWHNEFETHGKEIVACLPYLPLLLGALGVLRQGPAFGMAVVLFAVAGALHESAILHAPGLCVAAWAMSRTRGAVLFGAATILVAAAIAATVLLTGPVASKVPLCEAILLRGVDQQVCGIPFDWAAAGFDIALSKTVASLPHRDWVGIIATFGLAYLPLVLAIWPSRQRGLWLAFFLLTFISFLPLYVVAVDYGRWLNMQISAVTLTLLVATASGWEPAPRRALARVTFVVLFGLALLWKVSMVSGTIGPGVLQPALLLVM